MVSSFNGPFIGLPARNRFIRVRMLDGTGYLAALNDLQVNKRIVSRWPTLGHVMDR